MSNNITEREELLIDGFNRLRADAIGVSDSAWNTAKQSAISWLNQESVY